MDKCRVGSVPLLCSITVRVACTALMVDRYRCTGLHLTPNLPAGRMFYGGGMAGERARPTGAWPWAFGVPIPASP